MLTELAEFFADGPVCEGEIERHNYIRDRDEDEQAISPMVACLGEELAPDYECDGRAYQNNQQPDHKYDYAKDWDNCFGAGTVHHLDSFQIALLSWQHRFGRLGDKVSCRAWICKNKSDLLHGIVRLVYAAGLLTARKYRIFCGASGIRNGERGTFMPIFDGLGGLGPIIIETDTK